MILYAQLKNPETGEYLVINQIDAKNAGWQQYDLEISYEGKWYLAGNVPQPKPAELAQEEINRLEATITARNIRSAILGDEVAIEKITTTEAQIAELRKQLNAETQNS
ncbi:MAG: hypothetical protein IKD08_06945 [Alphaproteobacteria bacterium]|nr:hypothetical protein [Alphaproteobacteria bacterium]